jgi:hypothetical protein
VRSRIPDLSRLRRTIRFRPAFTLEATIRDVIEQTVARLRRA